MKKQKKSKKGQMGFTLIELLIVVTILGILAGIILPRFTATSDEAKKSAHRAERQNINSQIELFFFNEGIYPTDFTTAEWSQGSSAPEDYFPDGMPGNCPVSPTAWSISTTTNRVDMVPHPGHE